ncbi:MAG: hypothetical protein LIR50_15000 [Bacillota bacterium]|nr:hypothetical protein [Bacillota bacterium]
MAKIITISFKENERDIKIYDYLKSRGDKSNFIKDLIEQYLISNVINTNDNLLNIKNDNNIVQDTIIENKDTKDKVIEENTNDKLNEIKNIMSTFGG